MKRSYPIKPATTVLVGQYTTLRVERGMHECDAAMFALFENFMQETVKSTPNPMRPSTNILRKQCVFLLPTATVTSYNFGQFQDTFVKPICEMPPLASTVFQKVQETYPEIDMVQCNYYKDGSVGMSPHQDNESSLDPNHPILSVTFYAKQEESRPLTFYTLDDQKIMDLYLGHGDFLVMRGQEETKHGIEKERANKYGPRINFTLRKSKNVF